MSELLLSDFLYLTRIHYHAVNGIWGEHEIDYVLFIQKDNVTLDPNPDEISEIRWVSKSEIKDFVKNIDSPLSPWFKLILENKLLSWWDNLNTLDKMQDHVTIHRYI